jgi:hypothetical protein
MACARTRDCVRDLVQDRVSTFLLIVQLDEVPRNRNLLPGEAADTESTLRAVKTERPAGIDQAEVRHSLQGKTSEYRRIHPFLN